MENQPTQSGGTVPAVGSSDSFGSVIEEYSRLDKIIRDCEQSLRMADRLIAQGRWNGKWDRELAETHAKLASTLREREWLDGALTRAASLANSTGQPRAENQ